MFLEVFRFDFEWQILDALSTFANDFFNLLAKVISEAGSSPAVIVFITISYWCINKDRTKKIAFICFSSMSLLNTFKMLFSANRPFQYPGKEYLRKFSSTDDDGATGSSFPSGHANNSWTLYGEYFYNFKKVWLRIICVIFMILVPLSRLYLGVHFPGDVFVGAILAVAYIALMEVLYVKVKNFNIVKIITIGIFTLVGIYILIIGKENLKDFFTAYGLLVGFYFGDLLESKYVNFKHAKSFKLNVLRYVIAIAITLAAYFGLSVIRHINTPIIQITYILYAVTYGITCLIAGYVAPLLFKVIPFLREKE